MSAHRASIDFTLPAIGGELSGNTLTLSSLRGRRVVLYFYPKDSTPGCTTEAQNFRDLYPKFRALDVEILGISRDSLKSHDNFACKHALPFPLLSDADETFPIIHHPLPTTKSLSTCPRKKAPPAS